MPKAKKATEKPKTKARRRARKARRNPAGELAKILYANPGGGMAKKARKQRRKRRRPVATAGAAPVRKARRRRPKAGALVARAPRAVTARRGKRRARKNPEGGIGDVLIDAAGATVGMVGARYVQNLTALKMGTKDKAQASKPLHIALGALAPTALGFALSHFGGKKKLGNALMAGGLVFGAGELLRTFVFGKAQPGTALYPLAGPDDEHLGAVTLGEDGLEYAYVPDRGWMQISAPGQERQTVRRQLGAFDGLAVRDQLGQLGGIAVRDELGGISMRDQLGGISMRDELGAEEQEMGASEDELGAGDEWGTY